MRILICGLSGSGKTHLARQLQLALGYTLFNGDDIRMRVGDWDFSKEGRIRQAERMAGSAQMVGNAIIDIIAPLQEQRDIIAPDFTIWMNTTKTSRYPDTDEMFEEPTNADITITDWNYNINQITYSINTKGVI